MVDPRPVAGFYGMQGRFDEARELARRRAIDPGGARPPDRAGHARLLERAARAARRQPGRSRPRERPRPATSSRPPARRGWLSTMATMHARRCTRRAASTRRRRPSREAARPRRATISTRSRSGGLAMARILAHRGDLDEAERLAREAIEIIDRSDELSHQGDSGSASPRCTGSQAASTSRLRCSRRPSHGTSRRKTASRRTPRARCSPSSAAEPSSVRPALYLERSARAALARRPEHDQYHWV